MSKKIRIMIELPFVVVTAAALVLVSECLEMVCRGDYRRDESSPSGQIRLHHYTNSGVPWNVENTDWKGEGQLGHGLYCYKGWIRPFTTAPMLTIELNADQWQQLSSSCITRRLSWRYCQTLLLYVTHLLQFPHAVKRWISSSFDTLDWIEGPMLAAPPAVRQVVLKPTPKMRALWNTAFKEWTLVNQENTPGRS